jgi:DNA-binding response OmpR family regulator
VQGGVTTFPVGRRTPNDPQTHRTVLVVDGYPAVLAWTTRAFQCAGWEILGATDAQEARQRWQDARATALPVTLLVTDLDQPGLDGASLIQDLLRLDEKLAVLVLTGRSEPFADWSSPVEAQTAFLRKPVRTAQVVAAANTLCGVSRLQEPSVN